MASAVPDPATPWAPLAPESVAEMLDETTSLWWLSGGAALDRWLGAPIRDRANIDVSTTSPHLPGLLGSLPATRSAWVTVDGTPVPWQEAPDDVDPHPVLIHDDQRRAWVLQIAVEDGSDRAWIYRRDPRLQLPWDSAVLDMDGIPTGAPEVQLLWKALRPRPEDDIDKDAVAPLLPLGARAWWEKALLSIHPHSSWAIQVRSPMFPAKASWNRARD
ncbi:hypothetical protein QWJ90_04720 [Microbacterium oryzae]|uniref:nucleotidyltransferase domain-containing protein n=1 Tax=Microbacterium oryzae TaxID=743009 RepID=UPI0025AFAFB9|nr:hypothetical protein [Microbacterium oryzae]MDN3310224.1 hypothetical protein [Microbacterium oryzae]